MLKLWKEKLVEEGVADERNGDEKETSESLAHRLWLKANTKACPACSTPIEKIDGCNHMTCQRVTCRHEFCWICLERWDRHGTNTGGYYRCNRFNENGAATTNKQEVRSCEERTSTRIANTFARTEPY